uniref:Alkylglycerone-phosphate synthase n=1 Tax=Lygus hesperus TaxID=30085 RepID=A0A0A9YJT7_LYGHE
MVAAIIRFEDSVSTQQQERRVYNVATRYHGLRGGSSNGLRGYFLTYIIAYLRDFGFNYQFIAESFETTVHFSYVKQLIQNVRQTIYNQAKALNVRHQPLFSARVTQIYDTGVCVYFYFGFIWEGLPDPVAIYSKIEHAAREEILTNHGTISHHHGVGKLRSSFMLPTLGHTGMQVLRNIKTAIDPTNIFGSNNLNLTSLSPQIPGKL